MKKQVILGMKVKANILNTFVTPFDPNKKIQRCQTQKLMEKVLFFIILLTGAIDI